MAFEYQLVELSQEVQRLIRQGRVSKLQAEDVYAKHKAGLWPIGRAIGILRILEQQNGFEPSASFVPSSRPPEPPALQRAPIRTRPEQPAPTAVPTPVISTPLPRVQPSPAMTIRGGTDAKDIVAIDPTNVSLGPRLRGVGPSLGQMLGVYGVAPPPTRRRPTAVTQPADVRQPVTVSPAILSSRVPLKTQQLTGGGTMSPLDLLGSVIGGVAQVQAARYNQPVTVYSGSGPGLDVGDVTDAVGITNYGGGSCGPLPKNAIMMQDGKIGYVYKSRRRRRRRLATASDIRDLSALKDILGNGQSFKTWIATRGRC